VRGHKHSGPERAVRERERERAQESVGARDDRPDNGPWAGDRRDPREGATGVGQGRPSRGEGFFSFSFLSLIPFSFLCISMYIYVYIRDFLGVN
jgi:hypothetical protein